MIPFSCVCVCECVCGGGGGGGGRGVHQRVLILGNVNILLYTLEMLANCGYHLFIIFWLLSSSFYKQIAG